MEEVNFVVKKRVRDSPEETESDTDSPEVKRLRESLLDGLDDDSELCTLNHDLDSFMKSFEDEITVGAGVPENDVVDLTSDSGESRPDLGYLLEASDDELGIPPPAGLEDEFRPELVRVESDSSEFGGEFWENPGYDSFGYGEAGNDDVALDGFFDYYDTGFGSGDIPRRPESLPAQ
ncbi:hypothetical protein ABFS82_12G078600 [Erythranthe guttata]